MAKANICYIYPTLNRGVNIIILNPDLRQLNMPGDMSNLTM